MHVTNLFIAHLILISFFHCYNNIFLLNRTYQINKYKILLFNIFNINNINIIIQLALIFLMQKSKKDYT